MSKITKGIQDEETFTHTKCTSTVIYKYSSPSSFHLSENKKSKCREQFKDLITQPFWRADTTAVCHTVHSIYRTVHTYRCNLLVKVYTSAKQDAPLDSDTASDHALTLTHICTQVCTRETAQAHTLYIFFSLQISVHADIKHTHPRTHTNVHFIQRECCPLIIVTKALQGFHPDIVCFYQSASSSI